MTADSSVGIVLFSSCCHPRQSCWPISSVLLLLLTYCAVQYERNMPRLQEILAKANGWLTEPLVVLRWAGHR